MNIQETKPPRRFKVGLKNQVEVAEVAKIQLTPDEFVTFVGGQGSEYDVTRKDWGFYATPSINGRLLEFGLRATLVKNTRERWFVLLVEKGSEDSFDAYCRREQLKIIGWLDDEATLKKIEAAL